MLKSMRGAYRYMEKYFALPSVSTLRRLLKQTPFKPGINIPLEAHMRELMKNEPVKRRTCVLIFDEVAIQSHLTYNVDEDIIWGFQNFGTIHKSGFAEQALVFMLRGLCTSRWKLPYAFMFVGATTDTPSLMRCIKEVLRSATSANFNVVATICDQGRTNMAAIENLRRETRALCFRQGRDFRPECFEFEGKGIVTLYDPPHLLKGMRNNLLTKDLEFSLNNVRYRASWTDIVQFYNYDGTFAVSRCPALTEECVIPHKIRKMSVRHAAKVFSLSVYAGITNLLTEMPPENCEQPHGLKRSAEGTAKLVQFLDNLFDSVNGSRDVDHYARSLRKKLSCNSDHWEFWNKAKLILGSMKFVQRSGRESGALRKDSELPHSLTNWTVTLNGIAYLWNSLMALGFSTLDLRALNQDPLEKFFGSIRSHLGCNRNPKVASFISSFRTLSVNNFMSAHSAGSNCSDDDDDVSFAQLKSFLNRKVLISSNSSTETDETLTITPDQEQRRRQWSVPPTAYVAGFVARRILKLTRARTCSTCTELLLSGETLPEHSLIQIKELTVNGLTRPRTKFMYLTKVLIDTTFTLLPQIGHDNDVGKKIIRHVKATVDLTGLNCKDYDIADTFVKFTVKFSTFVWCKRINRYLTGQDRRIHAYLDPIQRLAIDRYNKSLKHTKRK